MFRIEDASFHESSRARVLMCSTNTGTKIVARISPSTSWYTMFGIEFARLYVSGSFDSVTPIAHAITAIRPKPVRRDRAVPMLIARVARAREGPFSSGMWPIVGPSFAGNVEEGSREDISARVSAHDRPGGCP